MRPKATKITVRCPPIRTPFHRPTRTIGKKKRPVLPYKNSPGQDLVELDPDWMTGGTL